MQQGGGRWERGEGRRKREEKEKKKGKGLAYGMRLSATLGRAVSESKRFFYFRLLADSYRSSDYVT